MSKSKTSNKPEKDSNSSNKDNSKFFILVRRVGDEFKYIRTIQEKSKTN